MRMPGAALPDRDLRQPVLSVLSDGATLPNLIDGDVLANTHFAAARFRLRFALAAADAAPLFQPGALLDVQATLNGAPVSLVQGEADSIRMDVIDRSIEVEGRDLTARLLDARTQETFSNQTASEIATTLATRHGLTPDVTATSTLAGRYYSTEHDRITLGQFSRAITEWDLLAFLAAREGLEVHVSGQTLRFGPAGGTHAAAKLTPGSCISLQLEQALTLARDLEVTVKSWNSRQQKAFSQTARSSGRGSRGSQVQRIVVLRPNLAPNDALQLAQRILADLSLHERIVHAELPGELSLTAGSQIELAGTGTDFDRDYVIAELDRHFSRTNGFTQQLRLKTAAASASSAAA